MPAITALWITEERHAAALVDAENDGPREAQGDALKEKDALDPELLAVRVPVLQIPADRSAGIQVLRDLQPPPSKAVDLSGERVLDLVLELPLELLHDRSDDASRLVEHAALQLAAEREEELQEVHVRLEAPQGLRVGHELRESVSVERVLLDQLDRLAREELPHLAQPPGNRQLRRVERSLPAPALSAFAHAPPSVLARVQEVERPLHARRAVRARELQMLARVAPEDEPPARQGSGRGRRVHPGPSPQA